MKNEWKSPKTIFGNVATGKYYYPRTDIVEEIWNELEKGSFVLLAAPRRVGKTSVLRDLEQNPRKPYRTKFQSVQAVQSAEEFYKTIYDLIVTCFNSSKRLGEWFKKYLQSRTVSEVTIEGSVKFEKKTFPYQDEINKLLLKFDDSIKETVVLLLDELPEVLHRLDQKGKKDEALSILSQLRVWRQNDFKKLQFVFAGSIGIHYVVKTITGRVSDINDLVKVICAPLNEMEAKDYIQWATEDASIQYDDDLMEYLLKKIQHYFTPYFLNLMLGEIDKTAKKQGNTEITSLEIDTAFNKIVKSNDYFKDWKKRLEDYMPNEDFLFVNEILIHIAHKDVISIQAIYDKATKYGKETDYMDFINDLEEDGYIITDVDGNFQFISPFLKVFWKNNQPVYHG
jgi:hypothetical protein